MKPTAVWLTVLALGAGCTHMPHHHSKLYTAQELAAPVAMQGAPAAGDATAPIVELMPIVMRHEQALQLTPEQSAALAAYRREAAPVRMAIQKNLLALRANLRQAILHNAPQSQREALMDQITQAELMHMQSRNRCAEFLRQTLSAEQFERVKALYLQSLQPKSQ